LKMPDSLPKSLAVLNGAAVLIAFVADSTYAQPSVFPLIVFQIDYPVSLLVLYLAYILHELLPSASGWSPWILFLVLGSLWYGFMGWILKMLIAWMYRKMHHGA